MGPTYWRIHRRGEHLISIAGSTTSSSSQMREVHDIDPRFLELVTELINKDMKSMHIRVECTNLKCSSIHAKALQGAQVPFISQISNCKQRLKVRGRGIFAYQSIADVKSEAERHLTSVEAFYSTCGCRSCTNHCVN